PYRCDRLNSPLIRSIFAFNMARPAKNAWMPYARSLRLPVREALARAMAVVRMDTTAIEGAAHPAVHRAAAVPAAAVLDHPAEPHQAEVLAVPRVVDRLA